MRWLCRLLAICGMTVPSWAEDVSTQIAQLQARLTAVEAQAAAAKLLADQGAFNAGDNTWVLVSALLVLFMTIPRLALFYGGLVRRQHVLGTMMQSLAITATITVIWAVCGFGLVFGEGKVYGEFTHLFLDGVKWSAGGIPGPNADYAASIPYGIFFLFQLMFALITPAVICGAYAERMKFSATLAFSVLWFFVVYVPLGIWSGAKADCSIGALGRITRRSLISLAEPWSRPPLEYQVWSASSSSGALASISKCRCRPTTSPWPSWVQRCYGSAGSASTPVLHFRQGVWQPWRQ